MPATRRVARAAVGFLLLFTFFRMAPLHGWDDVFYVAQLTSAVGDRDLMLQDDLLALGNPFPMRFRALTTILDNGALQNTFSIGPPLVHAAYTWPIVIGRVWPDPGVLRVCLAVGSMVALIVLVVAMADAAEWFGVPPASSDVAAVLAVAAGPLALYGTRSYLGSHLLSALWCAVLLRLVQAWLDEPRLHVSTGLGLAAGLMVVTRWQDALLAAALLLPAFTVAAVSEPQRRRARLRSLVLVAAMAVVVLAVQALAWRAQYGTWLLVPQGAAYVSWTQPHLVPFLASTYHGLLPWAPGLALGLAGLALVRAAKAPSHRALLAGLALGAAATIYVSSCVWDWWGGDSYGPRRLAVLTPLAACGLGALLARLPRPGRWVLVVAIGAWSAITVTAFASGYDDLRVAWGGSPDPANPLGTAPYETARWIDAPGTWPRLLRPGFTFSDRPNNRDRMMGAMASLAVLVLSLSALDRVRRSPRAQRAVVWAGAVWVLVALAWTASLPSNGAANSTWADIVSGAAPELRVRSLPDGVGAAAWAVAAVHAAEQGQATVLGTALTHVPAALRVAESDVRAVLDAEGRRYVRDLRSGRRIVLP